MALNDRRLRFIEEYLVDMCGAKAAVRAGYSERTANRTAYDLLQEPEIAQEIERRIADRSERTGIDSDWVLRRLAEEAVADLADLYAEDGGLKPIHEWPKIWRQGLVAGVETVQEYDFIAGEKVPACVVKKIKLSDRIRRLELIGKHINVGAFAERHEHTGKDGGPIETKDVSINEQARRIAFLLSKGLKSQA